MKCAERFESIPYSSDHLWNADHHNCPVGPCLHCGEDYFEYSERAQVAIEPLLPEYYRKEAERKAKPCE